MRILRCHMQNGVETKAAIRDCLARKLYSADAVLSMVDQSKFNLINEIEPLDLSHRPNLGSYTVEVANTSQYQVLLKEQENEQFVA